MPRLSATWFRSALAASVLAGAGVTATAWDGHDGDRLPIDIAAAEARATEHFKAADTDGDGLISASEFEALKPPEGFRHRKHFRPEPWGEHRHHGRGEDAFDHLDRDGDGVVTREEFDSRHAAFKAELFKRLDTDADGYLQPGEFPPHLARLRSLDTNGDGQITRDELGAHRRSVDGA